MMRSGVGRMSKVRIWVMCCLRGTFVAWVITFIISLILQYQPSTQPIANWTFATVFPVLLCLFMALFYQLFLIQTRGQLRLYLKQRKQAGDELPVCLRCGYAIESKVSACPECGAAL